MFIQWVDKRAVTLLSTLHHGTDEVQVQRKVKVAGQRQIQNFRMPQALSAYNASVGGADSFDQMASSYTILRRENESWKLLVYDIIEIAVINSYIVMERFMS